MYKTMTALMLLLVLGKMTLSRAEEADYPYRPVPFTDVQVDDTFWKPRMETNRTVTIPYAFGKCEENGRMDNFKIAGGLIEGEHRGGFPFDDTDPYKIAEGASYALMLTPDPVLEEYLDDLIAMIAAAQEDDGYLYTCRTNKAEHLENWSGSERWEKLAGSHELYNAGHMYEAAAAHFQATGKRSFLDVAIKNADLMVKTFGPGKLQLPPGHQVIEMGLAKLYRATGKQEYLQLAKFLLDARGRELDGRALWGPYNQDHKPVVEQDEAVGHAVRASYMYAGMADIAALTSDADYLTAIDRIWNNVVSKKLYLTGGIGATGAGEAFGGNYELPNLTAYNETCAAIGNVYWNHRLFLLHGEAKYIDVLERTLYNGLISGVSLEGDKFFYPNPLESDGRHERSAWFGCACCPGNVTRFMASVPGYAYAHRDDRLYVNLFVAGKATLKMADQTVTLKQETRYPWDGAVRLTVEPEQSGKEFTLAVRIPGWARNEPVPSDLYRFMQENAERPTLKVNGRSTPLQLSQGYATIRRAWNNGDVVELNLPMPIRRVLCYEKVEANTGKVALQRGPIVYCVEWPDIEDGHVLNLLLTDDVQLKSEYRHEMLGGVEVLRGQAVSLTEAKQGQSIIQKPTELLAIPYYAWAHRGKGQMAVWLPRTEASARPLPAPTIASTAEVKVSRGTRPEAMHDLSIPKSSGDHDVSFFHWWPNKGTAEWVEYRFKQPTEVSAVEIYWFDDTGRGECRLPASWRLFYKDGDQWKPVTDPSPFGCEIDRFNRTTFDPVTTEGLRLEVQLPENFAAGIQEWKVEAR